MGQQEISTHTEDGGNQCPLTLWTAEREGLKLCSKIQVRSSLGWDTRKYTVPQAGLTRVATDLVLFLYLLSSYLNGHKTFRIWFK